MTNYVILDMIYNSTYIMGSLIGSYFNIYDWNNGSMISLILFALICIISIFTGKADQDEPRQQEGDLMMKKIISLFLAVLVALFMYIPVLIPGGFTVSHESTTIGAIRGFSLHNYVTLFTMEELRI